MARVVYSGKPSGSIIGCTGIHVPRRQNNRARVGWFPGFVGRANRRVFFTTVLECHGAGVEMNTVRRRLDSLPENAVISERILREIGDQPS